MASINFLDKFCFKQPKSKEKRDFLRKKKKHRSTLLEEPPNKRFTGPQTAAPAEDEKFYATYFQKRPAKKPKTKAEDSDSDDLSDLADQAMEDKINELAGGEEGDSELSLEPGSSDDDLFEGMQGLREMRMDDE